VRRLEFFSPFPLVASQKASNTLIVSKVLSRRGKQQPRVFLRSKRQSAAWCEQGVAGCNAHTPSSSGGGGNRAADSSLALSPTFALLREGTFSMPRTEFSACQDAMAANIRLVTLSSRQSLCRLLCRLSRCVCVCTELALCS
jgi:hypothetical protein